MPLLEPVPLIWMGDRTRLHDSVRTTAIREYPAPSALSALPGGSATIHWQVDTSDEAALVGSKEHRCRCKLVRSSKSSHENHIRWYLLRSPTWAMGVSVGAD
jgi:hypothetical protein